MNFVKRMSSVKEEEDVDRYENALVLKSDGDEDEDDLPSFMSVQLAATSSPKKADDEAVETPPIFYDSCSRALVEIENFAFPDGDNHFDDESTTAADTSASSLALLDPSQWMPGQDVLDPKRNRPKIPSQGSSFSSEDGRPTTARRRLSEEKILPSRSNPTTPRRKSEGKPSRIPRFQKQTALSSVCGPVQRKVAKRSGNGSGGGDNDTALRPNLKLAQMKSHSASNLNRISVIEYHNLRPSRRRQSRSSSCGSIGGKPVLPDYSRIESKVKQYIAGVKRHEAEGKAKRRTVEVDEHGKSFMLSPGRKSLSMSNLVMDDTFASSSSAKSLQVGKMKAFLSSKHLDEVEITVRPKSQADSSFKSCQADSSFKSCSQTNEVPDENFRLSRLLDNLSEDEGHGLAEYDAKEEEDVCIYPLAANDNNVVVEVEDLLKLAIEERRGKKEAKHVLAELQRNYDELQRKFARAENIIDKLRFGKSGESLTLSPLSERTFDWRTEANDGGNGPVLPPIRLELPVKPSPKVGSGTSTSSGWSPVLPPLEEVKKELTEIREQVHAMELLTTNSVECDLTPVEKEALVGELLSNTLKLKSQTEVALQGDEGREESLETLKDIAAQEDRIKCLQEAIRCGKSCPQEKHAFSKGVESKAKQQFQGCCGSDPVSPTHSCKASACELDSGCCLGSDRSGASRIKNGCSSLGSNLESAKPCLAARVQEKPAGRQKRSPKGRKACLQCPGSGSGDEMAKPNMRTIERELERMASSSAGVSPRKNDDDEEATSVTPSTALSLRLAPPSPSSSGYTPRGGSTMILAQQIDQEILELRSVFEGHRDEMMSLLESSSIKPIVPANDSKSDSDGNIRDARRKDFELRRMQKLLKSKRVKPGISRFFPDVRNGRILPTASGGQMFIPNLNLDDVTSSENFNNVDGDDRSFDFNQAQPSAKSDGPPSDLAGTKRPKVESVATQVEPRSLAIAKVMSLSVESVEPPVDAREVSCQTNELTEAKEPSVPWRGVSTNAEEAKPGENAAAAEKARKKAKRRKELKDLLESLNRANAMAERLKERSEGMLSSLSSEISSFKPQPSELAANLENGSS